MKRNIIIALVMLVAAGRASALPTLEVTSGSLVAFFSPADLIYDLRGAGFEIGPGAWSNAYIFDSVEAHAFFPLANLFNCPGASSCPPLPQYVDVTFHHQSPLILDPHGAPQSTPFSMTGDTGFYDLSASPPVAFLTRQPQAYLIGHGIVTATPDSLQAFRFSYVFGVPEPSALLLLGSSIAAVEIARRWAGRRRLLASQAEEKS
jgi:hypothetical protein